MKKWVKRTAIALGAIIVIPIAVLFLLGFRSGAGKTHASLEIVAPPDQVWAWIDDGSRLKQWVSWMVEVRESHPPHHAIGSTISWVMKDANNGGMLVTLDGTFKEYQPPQRLTLAIESPMYGFSGTESYHLTDLGNGRTRLDQEGAYQYNQWFARLMEPLISMEAGKKMAADLARLKTLAETKAEAGGK